MTRHRSGSQDRTIMKMPSFEMGKHGLHNDDKGFCIIILYVTNRLHPYSKNRRLWMEEAFGPAATQNTNIITRSRAASNFFSCPYTKQQLRLCPVVISWWEVFGSRDVHCGAVLMVNKPFPSTLQDGLQMVLCPVELCWSWSFSEIWVNWGQVHGHAAGGVSHLWLAETALSCWLPLF